LVAPVTFLLVTTNKPIQPLWVIILALGEYQAEPPPTLRRPRLGSLLQISQRNVLLVYSGRFLLLSHITGSEVLARDPFLAVVVVSIHSFLSFSTAARYRERRARPDETHRFSSLAAENRN
jgi:hypothetical protein